MSLVFNMVGGGGGISENRAVLVARVPAGSTVTATKGGVTLTPKMWVVESDPTQDIALFVIAPSLFDSVNPWTVTATLGTDTVSDTVIIDDNKEYDVELSFTLWFVKDGIALVEPQLIHLEVVPNRYYTLYAPGGSPCPIVAWQINTTVEFSTVTFEFWGEKMTGSTGRCGISGSVLESSTIANVNATYISSVAIPPISSSLFTRTVDISNMVTNGKYIQCTRDWGSGANFAYELKSVYLTPASEVTP